MTAERERLGERAAGQRRRHLPGRPITTPRQPAPSSWATSTATAGSTSSRGADRHVSVLLGNGDGTFYAGAFAAGSVARRGGVATSTATAARTWRRRTPARTRSRSCSTTASGAARRHPAVSRIGDVTVTEGNTGTVDATFTVTLSAASTQPVTVALRHRQRHRHGRQRLPGQRAAR